MGSLQRPLQPGTRKWSKYEIISLRGGVKPTILSKNIKCNKKMGEKDGTKVLFDLPINFLLVANNYQINN
jgi:hypothetical protein